MGVNNVASLMGNTCSSEFYTISNASDVYFVPGVLQKNVLGPGYAAAWPISLAVGCSVLTLEPQTPYIKTTNSQVCSIVLIEWLVRALAACRSASMLPLPPMLFKFVGIGDRVRQLCIGIYAFLWIFFFIYQIRAQGSATNVDLSSDFINIPWSSVYVPPPASPPTAAALRDSNTVSIAIRLLPALSLQLTSMFYPACSAGLLGLSAFSSQTGMASIVALLCVAAQTLMLYGSLPLPRPCSKAARPVTSCDFALVAHSHCPPKAPKQKPNASLWQPRSCAGTIST